MAEQLPTLRWGVVGTGMISSWFLGDNIINTLPNPKARHIIQAIGSSSLEKAQKFVQQHIPNTSPTLYDSYDAVYSDPAVDIVYIGIPHSFHHEQALKAIAAGKHVLCEKAFTLNAKQAKEVIEAARLKGVFLMEAMWTRFYPLVSELKKQIHGEKILGDVYRTFCDYSLEKDIQNLPKHSRYVQPSLGAGSLLDVGVYSLTWGLLTLDPGVGETGEMPRILAAQTLEQDVDTLSSVILYFPSTGRHGIITSTTKGPALGRTVARIEGTKGVIEVFGKAPSSPESFTFYPRDTTQEEKVFHFEKPGRGFWWEADACAQDIQAGRKENSTMPWRETLRVMEILDEARRQGGARFPQDND